MSTKGFLEIIEAKAADREDLFLATAGRLGAPLDNIEKDFWVCWTLNVLYHRLPGSGPRLLFKGGTSLSKAYGLINRFSVDIDVTVFRDDLGHNLSPEELAGLSGKKRKTELDAITSSCKEYIIGDLLAEVSEILAEDTKGQGRVEIDPRDASQQTLLVWYPRVGAADTGYIEAAVRIESGAKSALDPNSLRLIQPYIATEVANIDLDVPDVTTIDAERTFWDKIVIAHGLRNWFEQRGELRQEGERISRHYYDLHSLANTDVGRKAMADLNLGRECVEHAKVFFSRPDFKLERAVPGTFSLRPVGDMLPRLERDYENTKAMIFGEPPAFSELMASLEVIEDVLNS